MKVVIAFLFFAVFPSFTETRDSSLPSTHPACVFLVTPEQVQNWTEYWQKALRLDDWIVASSIVRAKELKPETLGHLEWFRIPRKAFIKVLSPCDYTAKDAKAGIAEDIEYTVLHELLHLHLAVLPSKPAAKEAEEGVVNQLADALMRLKIGPGFQARGQPASSAPPQSRSRQSAGDRQVSK